MIQTARCPDREVFEGFLSGKLDDDQLSEVEEHLAACPACGETVRSMHVDDTFLQRVRGAGRDGRATTDQEQLEPLLEQLEQLGNSRSEANASIAARRREVESMLAPCEGELGRLGHYVLLRPLGAGGMGIVYQAEDTKLRRLVALKILRPSLGALAKERFIHEARAAAAIENDNVVTIYDTGTQEGLTYLAMQWLDGETLEDRLQRQTRLPADDVIAIAAQIAEGLAAAHEQKLIHRDIKPANIWLEAERPRARILDFGLARCLDDDILLTETGMIAGTPAYMSPEQAQGQAIDERSDLFSLGTLLYRMLTGHLPFEADNALAAINAIQNETPAAPRQRDLDIPGWLSDMVMDLLEKDPRDRPQRATDVAHSLRTESRQYPVQPRQATCPKDERGGGPVWQWVAAGVAFLGILASAFVYRIATDRGDVVIKSNDPAVEVEVLQAGKLVRVIHPATQDRVTLKSGTYELKLGDASSSFRLDRNQLTLTRDGVEVVTVEMPTTLEGDVDTTEERILSPWNRIQQDLQPQRDRAFAQVREKLKQEAEAVEAKLAQGRAQIAEIDPFAEQADSERIAERVASLQRGADLLRQQMAMFDDASEAEGPIWPGRSIHINAVGTLADAPIDGDYLVEAESGTVPLGAMYGRVFVAGMTHAQAEVAIRQHLREILSNPKVQVTASRSPLITTPRPTQPVSPFATSIRDRQPSADLSKPEESSSSESIRVIRCPDGRAADIYSQFMQLFGDASIRLTVADTERILAVGGTPQELARLEELVTKVKGPAAARNAREITDEPQDSLGSVFLTPAELAECELRIVGIYSAQNHHQDDRVTVEVEATDKPLVLALSSYYSTCWQVKLAKTANVRLVIATHWDDGTLVEGLPSDIPVLRLTGGGLYAYQAPHNNDYRKLATHLNALTGLPVSTFQGAYQGSHFTVGGDAGRLDGLQAYQSLKSAEDVPLGDIDKAALAGCELYYYSHDGSGAKGDDRVTLVVGKTEKPAVIVVGAYAETWWRFEFLEEANVKQIIVGGYYEQLVEGVPNDLPIAFHTYFPNHSPDFFYGSSRHTAEGRKTITKLEQLTGLPVTHFETLKQAQRVTLGTVAEE